MDMHNFIYQYTREALDINRFRDLDPVNKGEYHEVGNKQHELESYHAPLIDKQGEYHVFMEWSFCPECKQIRNKRVVGLDEKSNTAHIRELVWHGEVTGI